MYICYICNYSTMYNSNFLRHNRSKKHKVKCNICKPKMIFSCNKCEKYYYSKFNLTRHEKICKDTNTYNNITNKSDTNNEYDKMQEKTIQNLLPTPTNESKNQKKSMSVYFVITISQVYMD